MVTIEEKACDMVDLILEDLADRKGLGGEWDQIDEDIKDEIHATWMQICLDTLEDQPCDCQWVVKLTRFGNTAVSGEFGPFEDYQDAMYFMTHAVQSGAYVNGEIKRTCQ